MKDVTTETVQGLMNILSYPQESDDINDDQLSAEEEIMEEDEQKSQDENELVHQEPPKRKPMGKRHDLVESYLEKERIGRYKFATHHTRNPKVTTNYRVFQPQ